MKQFDSAFKKQENNKLDCLWRRTVDQYAVFGLVVTLTFDLLTSIFNHFSCGPNCT